MATNSTRKADAAEPVTDSTCRVYFRRMFGEQEIKECPQVEAVDAIERAYRVCSVEKAIKALRDGRGVPCAFAVYSHVKAEIEKPAMPVLRMHGMRPDEERDGLTFGTVIARNLDEAITEIAGASSESDPAYWVCGPRGLASPTYELLSAGERHEIAGDYQKAKAYYDAACLMLGWEPMYEIPANPFYMPAWSSEHEEDRKQ